MSAAKAQPLGAGGRRRGPGRPPVAEKKGSSVCAWLTVEKHDQLVELAREKDVSVSKLVVDAVTQTYFDPILKP
jgi:hypothetical protein